MKAVLIVLFLTFASQSFAFSNAPFDAQAPTEIPQQQKNYPIGPDAQMTPGALCAHPDSYRYPEHIPYCNRNVDSNTKADIIAKYDETFGYHIEQMNRGDFKIDHYIPLCAGGDNDVSNLWPQHKSVYTITDPLESGVCEKMAQGKLKQQDAVNFVKAGKADLSRVEGILAQIRAL
jgi:hypothetical protein